MSIPTATDLEREVIVRYALPDRTGLGGTMFRQRLGDCTIGQLDLIIDDMEAHNGARLGRARTGSFPVTDPAVGAWLEILYARREQLKPAPVAADGIKIVYGKSPMAGFRRFLARVESRCGAVAVGRTYL
jgi:hypothetical protein